MFTTESEWNLHDMINVCRGLRQLLDKANSVRLFTERDLLVA